MSPHDPKPTGYIQADEAEIKTGMPHPGMGSVPVEESEQCPQPWGQGTLQRCVGVTALQGGSECLVAAADTCEVPSFHGRGHGGTPAPWLSPRPEGSQENSGVSVFTSHLSLSLSSCHQRQNAPPDEAFPDSWLFPHKYWMSRWQRHHQQQLSRDRTLHVSLTLPVCAATMPAVPGVGQGPRS